VIHADQTQSVEEVVKPQSVVDEIVENYYEDGAFTVTVEQINEEVSVPDNKGFGRHSAFDDQQSELPPAVLDQINWVKRETDSNKKEHD
jgi:hypothetical protein